MSMNRIERLIHNYDRYVSLPWDRSLSGAQKVWFVVYDKTDERRLRACLGEFELATKKAIHGWVLCDMTNAFPEWMATKEYKEDYFKAPEDLNLDDFEEYCARKVERPGDNQRRVLAQAVSSDGGRLEGRTGVPVH